MFRIRNSKRLSSGSMERAEAEAKILLEVLRMKGRAITVGSQWVVQRASNKVRSPGVRLIGMKASDRAAVHGTKPPMPDIVDRETVEMDVQRAKEEKEKRRKEIEDIVDAELKNKNLELLSDSSTN